VASLGSGKAGNLEVVADSIGLDNRGTISAATVSGEGGNIALQVQDLILMRNKSEISTEAGGTGNGGNIDVDSRFIVAVPNEDSNIIANAFQGRGGNINITTQRIFGLEYRPRLTPQSDITASSEFGVNGTVQINTPGIDPNRGLAQLPANVVDATGLIDRRCVVAGGTAQISRFTVTGRGGLPPNPNETLNEEGLLEDLGTPAMARDRATTGVQTAAVASSSSSPNRLVEAQGWIIGADGKVILTAQAPTATPQHPWQTPASCQSVSNSPEIFTLSPG
jgi:large exoprotein involved in heme utilization and adhesion